MAGALGAEACETNPLGGLDCSVSDTTPDPLPTPDPDPSPNPDPDRPEIRYLYTGFDPAVGRCYYWSRLPGGIDTWDPENDSQVFSIINSLPRCPPNAAPAVDPTTRAWEVYRSWQLAAPAPTFAPPETGITGLATYVGVSVEALTHQETLPSNIDLVVRAEVSAVTVDWGDDSGAVTYSPAEATPYPDGVATHTYITKTCPPDYRANHPRGHLCHPTLDAYPVTVTFTWTAGYQYDAGWIELESVDLTTTVPYDVDEVIGVLEP
jgi:hypothetical protein